MTQSAGDFAVWLGEIGRAVRDGADSDVPCGTCTACCTASQFIHVERDEAAIEHIPPELLFPTPGLADGPLVMGHNSNGHCPMLKDDACTIYEFRPRACRVYDCRIYAASGVLPDEPGKTAVAERVLEWRFDYDGESDELRHRAVRAAAAYLSDPTNDVFGGRTSNATRDSLIALSIYPVFLNDGESAEPTVDDVRAAIERARP
jgi:hypothetical protein